MEETIIKFNLLKISFVVLVFICEILSSEVPRPRGVSISRASLYIPENNFTCFDGSKTVPFTHVNDDYCDCSDGSDEPGTPACSNGIFYCTNAGHKSLHIGSSRVNDGICDCCDGSDEYASKKHCANNCLELGRTAREEAQRRAELVKAGKQLKVEMSQRGVQLKQEKQAKLEELERNRNEALKLKSEKEQLKNAAEEVETIALEYYRKLEEEERKKKAEIEAEKTRAEAVETFKKFDSNQDGLVDLSEIKTRQTFDKDKNGEVSDEEAKYFLNNEDKVSLETFIESCWSNVKPFLMMDAGLFKGPPSEQAEILDEAGEEEENEDIAEDGEGSPNEDIEDDEDEPEQHVDEEPSSSIVYDDDTQKLVEQATEARNEFAHAEKSVRDIENELKDIQEYLEKDFGIDEEFAILEGQCFEYTDHEYIYKLCPFEKTSQQPKSSSSETRLGVWGRWDGPLDNKYDVMLYDRGQSCWNGPQRSTKVRVHCGGENKLTSVSEPNRCEYMFDFSTPAACRDITSEVNDDLHDEL